MKTLHPEAIFRPTLCKNDLPEEGSPLSLYIYDIICEDKVKEQYKYKWNAQIESLTETQINATFEKANHSFFLFCVDKKGHSYTLHVDDYQFPIDIILPDESFTKERRLESIYHYLKSACSYLSESFGPYSLHYKQNTFGYEEDPNTGNVLKRPVMTLRVGNSTLFYKIRQLLKDTVFIDGNMVYLEVAEEKVDPSVNLLYDSGIRPCSWFTVTEWKYAEKFYTHDQVEIKTSYKAFTPDEECIDLPPLLLSSFDIECDNPEGFTKNGNESVICISTHVQFNNNPSSARVFTHYLKKKDVSPEEREKYRREVEKAKCIPDMNIQPTGTIFYFDNEYDMLQSWRDFIVHIINPDIIAGYNQYKYDWQYLAYRVAVLDKTCKIEKNGKLLHKERITYEPINAHQIPTHFFPQSRFFAFSKFINMYTPLIKSTFSASAIGENIIKKMHMPGRVQIDVCLMLGNHQTLKMVDLRLNTVSQYFLGESKEDLDAGQLYKIWRGGYDDEIIAYCETDARLPIDLILCARLGTLIENTAKSALTYTPLDFIFNSRVIRCLTNFTTICSRRFGYVMNQKAHSKYKYKKHELRLPVEEEYWSDDEMINNSGDKKKKGYSGAYVLDPIPGLYDIIVVLDFASLYPSIMIANNLCPSTLVVKKKRYKSLPHVTHVKIDDPDTGITHHTNMFVKKDHTPGLLSKMLVELLESRKKTKRRMALEEETATRERRPINESLMVQLDALQNAYKLISNSVYGVNANSAYLFGSRRVSESTTAIGREYINRAVKFVETEYKSLGARVVYGDTDSVMISIKHPSITNKYELLHFGCLFGERVASDIQKEYPPEVRLEFEKVYLRYVLTTKKKRYIGIRYMPKGGFEMPNPLPQNDDEWNALGDQPYSFGLDSRGFSIRERGRPRIVNDIVLAFINALMDGYTPEQLISLLKERLDFLINGNVDHSLFIMYKRRKKKYDMKTPPPHAVTCDKMEARSPGSAPKPGSFVPHIFLTPPSAKAIYDLHDINKDKHPLEYYIQFKSYCADDPHVLQEYRDMAEIDYSRYIDMIRTQCLTIFEAFPDYKNDIESLFETYIPSPKPYILRHITENMKCIEKGSGDIIPFVKKSINDILCKENNNPVHFSYHVTFYPPLKSTKRMDDKDIASILYYKLWKRHGSTPKYGIPSPYIFVDYESAHSLFKECESHHEDYFKNYKNRCIEEPKYIEFLDRVHYINELKSSVVNYVKKHFPNYLKKVISLFDQATIVNDKRQRTLLDFGLFRKKQKL